MSLNIRSFFLDRSGEVRAGWRIVLFMVAVLILGVLLIEPLSLLPGSLSFMGNVLILAAGLGATWVATKFLNRKPFTAVGLALYDRTPRDFGAGCLLGFLMMTGIFLIELGLGYAVPAWRDLSPLDAVWVATGSLAWFGAGALGEEVLFRGYAFQTLIQALTFLPATILMAIIFALAHVQNPNVTLLSLTNVALAGLLFSIAYMKTRSLWLPFGLHMSWNFSQTTLYGFPTSGIADASRSFVVLKQSGPDWVVGGPFGPEGGILATFALIVCTWYILKAGYMNAPEGIITLDSVEDLVPPRRATGAPAS